MTNVNQLTKRYLQGTAQTMQLATVRAGRPWVATVYFVTDDDMNVYWLSWPERRHSVDLAGQSDVAAAVAVKTDQPVIGVQLAGQASEVADPETVKRIMQLYVAKYGQGENFYDVFMTGKNRHRLYKLAPNEIALFDELTYPDGSPVTVR